MKYLEFQQKFKNFTLIDLHDVKNVFTDFDRRRFSEWQKRGLIKKVTSNFYVFADLDFNEEKLYYIANKIYSPSYISMETALRYYDFIPEAVYQIKSITTNKTKIFKNFLGSFLYQKEKNNLFFGYKIIRDNISFLMAEPEKAWLDFLYLRPDIREENDFNELRINKEIFNKLISPRRLRNYANKFVFKNVHYRIERLLKFIKKNA